MDDNQKQLFKMILEEVLASVTAEELAGMIDTFIGIYETKFGELSLEDTEPEEPELMHTRDATEYLKKFTK